uniref:ornithine decarboxylase n=1 Tax=Salarias fasciatus TaxID=181472 RepID=A0A672I0C6_SALFA
MMPGSLPVNQNIEILENGKTIRDIIDSKIKELDSAENQQPFFVANLDCVLKAHLRWTKNLPRVKPFYAVKCNDKPTVVSMLSALGTGFDCASKGEIQLALSLGVTPDKIIYANPTKPSYHIKYAASQGVDTMTFDNEEELLKISSLHAQAKYSLKKLNLKFGATLSSAGKLLERAAQLGLQVIGVSFHVGCLCTDSLTFKRAIADSRHVFDMAKSLGFKMSLLDIGGGFTGTDQVINESLDEFFPSESGVRIIAEPGRYFVESAFTLAVNVIAKKTVMNETEENSDNTESGPDRTMEYYINDGVFGSISSVLNFPDAVGSSELKYKSVIWGPTCDCIDKVLENYWIPELRVGDWLLMDNAGAYTLSICSDFNNFERALIYFSASADTYNRFMPRTNSLH